MLFPSQGFPFSLEEIIQKQDLLLHGEERRSTRFIPKPLKVVISRLI